jgi:cytidylate kinase
VYVHFASKEELLYQLSREGHEAARDLLVAAADAIIINSTGLSIAEVLQEMMFKVRERNAV